MTAPAIITAIAISGATLMARAGELPRGVFPLSQLEEAKAEARTKGQPLVFVYTDLKSTCGLCIGSTEDSFKSFRSRGTLVFVNSKPNELRQAPRPLLDMRMKPEMGDIIPMVMVLTADAAKPIKGYSYAELKGGQASKAARDLRRVLEETDPLGDGAKPEADGAAPDAGVKLLAEEQIWENSEGRTITAAVKAVSGSTVTFVLKGGKTVDYPLEKLSAAAREKIQDLED